MMQKTTTAVRDETLLSAVNARTCRRENALALSVLMYAQLLSMSALNLLSVASTGAYLSALLTLLPFSLLYFLSARCARKHAQEVPRTLDFLFALFFFGDMVLCLLSLTELVSAYVLPQHARLWIALPAALLTALGLIGKKRGGARRTAACLAGFFVFSLLICLLFALPEGDIGHIFPLLGYGGNQVLRGAGFLTGGVWIAGALPFFTAGTTPPQLKKPRPFLAPLCALLLFAVLLFCYALLLPAPLLPGKWGFVLQLQLIMEMSPSILSFSLMLISRMLLFLSSFAVAGDCACECLRRALKKPRAPILPLMLLAVPLALLPLHRLSSVLPLVLPARYALCLLAVSITLLARRKESPQ